MINKSDIEKLIVQHKKSNLKNHWSDAYFYNTAKYSGEVRSNEILLWRSSHFLRGAYPIFHMTFDQNDKLNRIRKEKNPFHKFINKFSIGFFTIVIITLFVLCEISFAVIASCGILLVRFLLNLVLKMSRNYEVTLITEELKLTLENIEGNKNPEVIKKPIAKPETEPIKEWTLEKVLGRLILYPFCGLIVYLSIVGIIPGEKKLLGVFGVIIGLGYPIVDLILAFRKRTTGNNI